MNNTPQSLYLKDVLGIEGILVPDGFVQEVETKQVVTEAPQERELTVFCKLDLDNEKSLLDKMLQAMKCPTPGSLRIISSLDQLRERETVLVMGEKAWKDFELSVQDKGTWVSYEEHSVIFTYGPKEALARPQLKKEVWRDLQRVMAKMGWS